jgi:glycosyltransferase involved in cell wall biosynthesis
VVAKARTGIREFVANGQEGLLAQSDRDMVDQLLWLIRDPELRHRIAAHNREVPSRVDWSEVVGVNVAAYHRAIDLMGSRRAAQPG